jgi:hypothetical protein
MVENNLRFLEPRFPFFGNMETWKMVLEGMDYVKEIYVKI